nr:11560_t:CDS:1 [Entrophospora candida]
MTIIVKSISEEYGDTGPNRHNDFKGIIDDTEFGGSGNIKQIDIKGIAEIKIGEYIDSIQFSYSVMTNDGISHVHQGVKWGLGLGGVPKEPVDFTANEQITKISGRLIPTGEKKVIRSLSFQTSQRTLNYGLNVVGDTEFSFPPGIIFGSSGKVCFSIGAYEITTINETVTPVTTPVTTTTVIVTTNSVTETALVDNPRTIIGFSIPLAVLSILLLVVLYYKYKKKNAPLRIPGSQPAQMI